MEIQEKLKNLLLSEEFWKSLELPNIKFLPQLEPACGAIGEVKFFVDIENEVEWLAALKKEFQDNFAGKNVAVSHIRLSPTILDPQTFEPQKRLLFVGTYAAPLHGDPLPQLVGFERPFDTRTLFGGDFSFEHTLPNGAIVKARIKNKPSDLEFTEAVTPWSLYISEIKSKEEAWKLISERPWLFDFERVGGKLDYTKYPIIASGTNPDILTDESVENLVRVVTGEPPEDVEKVISEAEKALEESRAFRERIKEMISPTNFEKEHQQFASKERGKDTKILKIGDDKDEHK